MNDDRFPIVGLEASAGGLEAFRAFFERMPAECGMAFVVIVTLPASLIVNPSDQVAVEPPQPGPHVSKRVLLADDNRDGAETLGMFLETLGHEVQIAHSGTEALQLAKRWKPDLCVLDIGMPDMSGYEVAMRIRLEAWGQKITLIAVTGWGQEDDRRRA